MSFAQALAVLVVILVALAIIWWLVGRSATQDGPTRGDATGPQTRSEGRTGALAGGDPAAQEAAQRANVARAESEAAAREAARRNAEERERQAASDEVPLEHGAPLGGAERVDPDVPRAAGVREPAVAEEPAVEEALEEPAVEEALEEPAMVEPVAEPMVEPVAEPMVEPVAEPMVEPVAEPAAGPVSGSEPLTRAELRREREEAARSGRVEPPAVRVPGAADADFDRSTWGDAFREAPPEESSSEPPLFAPVVLTDDTVPGDAPVDGSGEAQPASDAGWTASAEPTEDGTQTREDPARPSGEPWMPVATVAPEVADLESQDAADVAVTPPGEWGGPHEEPEESGEVASTAGMHSESDVAEQQLERPRTGNDALSTLGSESSPVEDEALVTGAPAPAETDTPTVEADSPTLEDGSVAVEDGSPTLEDGAPTPDDTSSPGDAPMEESVEEPAAAASTSTGRRISEFREIRDGGYGTGSAAPLPDLAQPMDHAIMGDRSTMTYLLPGDQGYTDEVNPDVWFYDEAAATRCGFSHEQG